MNTALHVNDIAPPEVSRRTDGHAPDDFSRRLHDAAALIPSGPPLGQWVFKLVTSELRGANVPAAEAVRRAIEAVRETDHDFEPQYDPQLLEQ
jgi:hypothetical protein